MESDIVPAQVTAQTAPVRPLRHGTVRRSAHTVTHSTTMIMMCGASAAALRAAALWSHSNDNPAKTRAVREAILPVRTS